MLGHDISLFALPTGLTDDILVLLHHLPYVHWIVVFTKAFVLFDSSSHRERSTAKTHVICRDRRNHYHDYGIPLFWIFLLRSITILLGTNGSCQSGYWFMRERKIYVFFIVRSLIDHGTRRRGPCHLACHYSMERSIPYTYQSDNCSATCNRRNVSKIKNRRYYGLVADMN